MLETLRIWSYLLKKPLMENFIFCAVDVMNIENFFNEKIGYQRYSPVMSLNRFKVIKRMLTFDDSTRCNKRWKKDKFSAFREEVLEIIYKKCARNYSRDDFLAIDETLYPARGSIGFKTYK